MLKLLHILSALSLALACVLTAYSDPAVPCRIDPEKPFHLALGRGGGPRGFAVVIVDESGRTMVTREGRTEKNGVVYPDWSVAEITLPHNLVCEIVDAANNKGMAALERSYSAHFYDGTKWELMIVQGNSRKLVIFDNLFPPAILEFAGALDEILDRGGLKQAAWQLGNDAPEGPLMKCVQLWKNIQRTK